MPKNKDLNVYRCRLIFNMSIILLLIYLLKCFVSKIWCANISIRKGHFKTENQFAAVTFYRLFSTTMDCVTELMISPNVRVKCNMLTE